MYEYDRTRGPPGHRRAGPWGAKVAAGLAREENCYVIGLDSVPPAKEIEGLDFILADVRNPLLAELF